VGVGSRRVAPPGPAARDESPGGLRAGGRRRV